MCIIIQRDPGFVIPRDKFDNCVINNPDGWGLSVPDGKGMLSTIRSVDGETNGDEVYSLLHDEFKDDKVLLHLRYTTAGETNLRNAHPFPILEEEVDGVDLRMAHNGTIHKYKHAMTSDLSWESDTRNFVRTFVRPLFKRMVAGVGPNELLKDEFITKLLNDQLTAASVLSFIDGFGNTLNVNGEGNGGKQEEVGTTVTCIPSTQSTESPRANIRGTLGAILQRARTLPHTVVARVSTGRRVGM